MLIACGINHHSAPLLLRERVALDKQHFRDSLQNLKQQPHIEEAAILSTCHRTEIYCKSQTENSVISWLLQWRGVSWEDIKPYLYVHKNTAVVKHLLRVASGVDSMVVGEPQIFGQIKQAFSTAQSEGTLGKHLHQLFQYTFASTKQIRTQTAIGQHPVSFAYAIFVLAKRIFEDIQQKTILLIGSGEMIEMIARYFHHQGVSKLMIVNRTEEKAQRLAQCFGAKAMGLDCLEEKIGEADVVVSALSSSLPLIGKGLLERTTKKRKRRPQLLVDLGLPRNMEPEIADLEDAYLYCLDDLKQIIKTGLQHRQKAAQHAESLIEDYTQEFTRLSREKEISKLIYSLRHKTEKTRDEEIEKALLLLEKGENPKYVLTHFARILTQKWMHLPTVKLHQAASEGRFEILQAMKYVFELMDEKI